MCEFGQNSRTTGNCFQFDNCITVNYLKTAQFSSKKIESFLKMFIFRIKLSVYSSMLSQSVMQIMGFKLTIPANLLALSVISMPPIDILVEISLKLIGS